MTRTNALSLSIGVLFVGALVLSSLALSACATTGRLGAEELEVRLKKAIVAAGSAPDRSEASILVYSPKLGLDILARAADGGREAFHVASVGKLFTAVLVGRLIDRGRLDFETRVAGLLPPGTLDGLFVVDGVDRQAEVTVDQLLAHRSGIADYFSDPASGGETVFDLMTREPDRTWTPAQLLDFVRTRQRAVAPPGESFHYSDSGYVVLGLVVEALEGRPFHEVLSEELFVPLGMEDSWMPGRSLPASGGPTAIRPAYIQGVEVSAFPSISADWAGGGVASTERDLLRFQLALRSGALLSDRTLARLETFDGEFLKGIRYGRGIMEYRFGDFFFLLGGYPDMVGHMGVLGTQLFYDPTDDLHIVVSLGTDAGEEASVRLLIEALGLALKAR